MQNKNLYKVLCEYGEEVIAVYRRKLQEHNKNYTHQLERSLTIDYDALKKSLEDDSEVVNVNLIAADHIEFVEAGRLPTKNGGTGELQKRIEEWIVRKPIQIRPSRNGTLPSIKSLAFLISRKIHTEGYHGTGLLKESVNEVYAKYQSLINEAIEKDVAEYVLVEVDTTMRNLFNIGKVS